MKPLPARVPSRVVIEGIEPEIDDGRFPAKRTVGDVLAVGADILTDGHDLLAAVLKSRHVPVGGGKPGEWVETPMRHLVNDRWTGSFTAAKQGWYEYTLAAWIDWFETWRRDLTKKFDAGQDVASELREGEQLIRQAVKRASGKDAVALTDAADLLGKGEQAERVAVGLDAELAAVMHRHADRSYGVSYDRVLRLWVDRERARYGSWYELFPRSCAEEPGRHGTFADVQQRLPYIAAMGFDVLYLPPIHPIGLAYRKGPNNTLTPGPTDPGSPWAIGGPEGGHKGISPRLGTFEDFDRLLTAAKGFDIELALDIAFQCSPDHPYVKEHPGWFKHRPDGTIKYAENPPKKYQDIYPIDFECDDWQALWEELLSVVTFWAERGVLIFRVDNPHTKPFRFWEWLIGNVLEQYPDAVFLSEAFTRPKVMKYLAKSGFSQSYSYFTWRNQKAEIVEYFEELYQTDVRDYMRPNLFANTPDILPEFLQYSGPPGFHIRFLLAATLGASYGIYGQPFETYDGTPLAPGKEEYLDSEKFQVRDWDWHATSPFRDLIARVNRIRKDHPALQHDHGLTFQPTDNDELIAYVKVSPDGTDAILTVVNLDPYHRQSGWVRLALADLGLPTDAAYEVEDLLTNQRFEWRGERCFVSLDPTETPAHVLRLPVRPPVEIG